MIRWKIVGHPCTLYTSFITSHSNVGKLSNKQSASVICRLGRVGISYSESQVSIDKLIDCIAFDEIVLWVRAGW